MSGLQVRVGSSVNDTGTRSTIDTPVTQPRSLSDLRSFLHGYRIKAPDDKPRLARASIIIAGADTLLNDRPGIAQAYSVTLDMQRAARELARLDPSLSWLPDWKPRVAVKGGS